MNLVDISMNAEAHDTVTGFTGAVTTKCEHLGGYAQVALETGSHDGKDVIVRWFDVGRIALGPALNRE